MLLEALVAVTVLTIGLVAVVGSVHHSLEALRITEAANRAWLLVDERVAAWEAPEASAPSTRGACPPPGAQCVWEAMPLPAVGKNVRGVRVSVRWTHRHRQRGVSADHWWLAPAPLARTSVRCRFSHWQSP